MRPHHREKLAEEDVLALLAIGNRRLTRDSEDWCVVTGDGRIAIAPDLPERLLLPGLITFAREGEGYELTAEGRRAAPRIGWGTGRDVCSRPGLPVRSSNAMSRRVKWPPPPREPSLSLADRDHAIARMAAAGMFRAEIARRLGLSASTVRRTLVVLATGHGTMTHREAGRKGGLETLRRYGVPFYERISAAPRRQVAEWLEAGRGLGPAPTLRAAPLEDDE
jgi:hypothetical protein